MSIPIEEVRIARSSCSPDSADHCITCSDEALEAQVLCVDQGSGMARVAVEDVTAEIDVSLVDEIVPGDQLLIHGGVALAKL